MSGNVSRHYTEQFENMTGSQRRAEIRKVISKPPGQKKGESDKFTAWILRADDAAELAQLTAESRSIRGDDLGGVVEWFCRWYQFTAGHCHSRYYAFPDGWFAD